MTRSLYASTACALLLIGCATAQPDPSTLSPEQRVTERANQRWQSVLAGDVEKAYSFVVPAYREIVDLQRYKANFGSAANRVGAQVVSASCEPEVCEVVVRVDFVPPLRPKTEVVNTHLNERWVLVDGEWWLHQRL